jgi:NADH-quinone oxidoreductase subunit D
MTLRKIFHGPQHPGVTGNMSMELDLDGETIVRAVTHVGYLHRGFEKLVERRTLIQAFTIVCRICVPEPDPNEENLARGIEELAGLEISERAKFIRVLVLELARLQAHLLWMAGQGGSIGHEVVPQWAIGERDYILDLFEELNGGRVYHMYIYPGGVRRDLPDDFLDRVAAVLDQLQARLPEYDRIFFENAGVKKRLQGVGVVSAEDAVGNDYSGPVIRGNGIARDVRRDAPYLVMALKVTLCNRVKAFHSVLSVDCRRVRPTLGQQACNGHVGLFRRMGAWRSGFLGAA